MPRKKLSRNAPCPCNSGKKHKNCCWGKGFDWEEDEGGDLYQSMPIPPEVADILQAQRQKFIDQHGRELGPNDPLFFDMSPLEQVEHQTVEAMKKAGIDPAFIYAFEKTGRLVTEENQHLLSESALDEWQAAIEEYEMKHSKKESPPYPLGTVAMYGPDDKTTTKLAAGVIPHENAEPILQRWVATNVTTNPKVQEEMREFFLRPLEGLRERLGILLVRAWSKDWLKSVSKKVRVYKPKAKQAGAHTSVHKILQEARQQKQAKSPSQGSQ